MTAPLLPDAEESSETAALMKVIAREFAVLQKRVANSRPGRR